MWTMLWNTVSQWAAALVKDPKRLLLICAFVCVGIGGCQTGRWLTYGPAYRQGVKVGYDKGYADGKGGERKRLFPNLFGEEVPADIAPEEETSIVLPVQP